MLSFRFQYYKQYCFHMIKFPLMLPPTFKAVFLLQLLNVSFIFEKWIGLPQEEGGIWFG